MTLRGKVALVTGGNHGIGRAICLGFAGQGVQMIQAQGSTALGIKCDVAQEDIRHLVDTTLACLVGHHDA